MRAFGETQWSAVAPAHHQRHLVHPLQARIEHRSSSTFTLSLAVTTAPEDYNAVNAGMNCRLLRNCHSTKRQPSRHSMWPNKPFLQLKILWRLCFTPMTDPRLSKHKVRSYLMRRALGLSTNWILMKRKHAFTPVLNLLFNIMERIVPGGTRFGTLKDNPQGNGL